MFLPTFLKSDNIKRLNLVLFFVFNSLNVYAANSSDSLIEKIEEAKKSVVHINATNTSVYKSPKARAVLNPATGQMIIARNVKAAQVEKTGTGVIISPKGLIATNFHTIALAETVLVTFTNGETVPAKIIHILPESDLALLQVNPPFPLQEITFADSNTVQIRDEVVNIGGSSLLNNVISGGRVNRLATNSLTKSVEFIQVTINLYKGDSGGPLFNRNGELIGMIMAEIKNQSKSTIAIPSNKIKILYLDFLK